MSDKKSKDGQGGKFIYVDRGNKQVCVKVAGAVIATYPYSGGKRQGAKKLHAVRAESHRDARDC